MTIGTYSLFAIFVLLFGYGVYLIFSSEINAAHSIRLINTRVKPTQTFSPTPNNFALENTIDSISQSDSKTESIQHVEDEPTEPLPDLEIKTNQHDTASLLADIDKKWDTRSSNINPPKSLDEATGNLVTNSDFSDFHDRLSREGAQTGQVQISLIWDNTNDLDLIVICPSGERISFDHSLSKCGGHLDVDMNESPTSDKPVENVFWPKDKAPKGDYKVLVEHFEQHAEEDLTIYRVLVNDGFEQREYSGEISNDEPPRVVCIFTVE
ncbi:MAG: hypothetical protein CL768_03350 [Chloroflexi bacterium]|nr:hypothetical protein [Chloroflexota bacterium]|tara:strand:- start:1178 stop:1978 length:801 start_codon:yes stop_codon:yes gene_type:complete